jgi:hypothetical protein
VEGVMFLVNKKMLGTTLLWTGLMRLLRSLGQLIQLTLEQVTIWRRKKLHLGRNVGGGQRGEVAKEGEEILKG